MIQSQIFKHRPPAKLLIWFYQLVREFREYQLIKMLIFIRWYYITYYTYICVCVCLFIYLFYLWPFIAGKCMTISIKLDKSLVYKFSKWYYLILLCNMLTRYPSDLLQRFSYHIILSSEKFKTDKCKQLILNF